MTAEFMKKSVTAWHGVREMEAYLAGKGFLPLREEEEWHLEEGQGYYLSPNGRSLAAFRVGRAPVPRYRIIAAHTDSPHLRIKPESLSREEQGLTGNVSVYGGPIQYTWFDRPLGVAGVVIVEGEDGRPERLLFDSEEPLGIIPDAPIHLNREVNKGFEIKPQKHLSVILTLEGDLEDYLAAKLGIPRERILSLRAELYVHGEPAFMGTPDRGFINSPRLDNLIHCLLAVEALAGTEPGENTPLVLCFDSEETGSLTAEGAHSALTEHIMERIALARGTGRESQLRSRSLSSLLSADVAHGWNGNFSDKFDPAYKCALNGGPVIKVDTQNHYATTADTEGMVRLLARREGIPLQLFITHSDVPTGSTVGPMLSSSSAIPCVDMGIPLWAMHSAVETVGQRDVALMGKLFGTYLQD